MENDIKFSFSLKKNSEGKYDVSEEQDIVEVFDLLALRQYLKEKLEMCDDRMEELVREQFFEISQDGEGEEYGEKENSEEEDEETDDEE